jgi:hypothetical protein
MLYYKDTKLRKRKEVIRTDRINIYSGRQGASSRRANYRVVEHSRI